MNKTIKLSEEFSIRIHQYTLWSWGGFLLDASGKRLKEVGGWSEKDIVDQLTTIARNNWGLV